MREQFTDGGHPCFYLDREHNVLCHECADKDAQGYVLCQGSEVCDWCGADIVAGRTN